MDNDKIVKVEGTFLDLKIKQEGGRVTTNVNIQVMLR